jgi:hypothetical protein
MIVCVFVTGSKEHYRQGYLLRGVTMVQGVIRCGEHESGVQTPQNRIGRPGTNENRVFRKHVILGYLDAGNTNQVSKHLENPLVDREPMKIEFAGNTFFWGISMWETQMHRPKTLKASGPPGTNRDRASWEIPPYSRLKEQLKSYIHFSYRTRSPEGRYRHNKD